MNGRLESRLRRTAAALAGMAAIVSVAGCGGNNSSTASDGTVGAPGAKVVLVKPKNSSTVAPTVTANVRLTNFKLAPNQVGKSAKQGEGHLHFSLDNGKYDY